MERERIVAHVINGAKQVFETMIGEEIEPGADYVENSAPQPSEAVVALIGMGGAAWMGTGMVTCQPTLACKLASGMLMAEYVGVNEDVLDAMAEIANMVFGHVKTEVEEELGGLALSIPTVVFGRNFITRSVGQQDWSVIPIKVGSQTMELRICMTPNRVPRSAGRLPAPSFALHEGG